MYTLTFICDIMENISFDNDPQYPEDNVYPPMWDFRNDLAWKLYRRAKKEQWDEEDLDWEKYKEILSGLDHKERFAIAYWWALLSNFDNATPVFAYALIKATEKKMPLAVRGLLTTITYDENRHNVLCGLAIENAVQGFPFNYKPRDELERKAVLNVKWVWWNGSRYWKAYLDAYKKYTLDILFTSFMMGEAAATSIFSSMKDRSEIPTFRIAFKNLTLDETRHYAFTHLLLHENVSKMSDEKKNFLTKQIRAGFVFLSLITYRPPKEFWKLPPWYIDVHEKMEELANRGGLGIPPIEEREKIWREAVLRIAGGLKKYGVKIPSMPEIGISGDEDIEIKEDDLIVGMF